MTTINEKPFEALEPSSSLNVSTSGQAKQTVKEVFAGCMAGVVQVIVGQPFDTVKVRLQTQARSPSGQGLIYSNAVDCIKKTITQEGASAFYKGTLSPLAGIGLCTSVQFGAMESMKRFLGHYNQSLGLEKELSPVQLYISGVTAGLVNSIISGPVEHIRTRMQVQTNTSSTKPTYSGTWDCARKIFKNHGWKGIYKGQTATILREAQGYGGYFAGYELFVRWMMERRGLQRRDMLDTFSLMLAGAFAGYCLWIPTFPIDVIKSKIQTDAFVRGRYLTVRDCANQIYQHEGLKGFYRGFWPCMIRAAPVNAATFLTFEMVLRLLAN